MTVKTDVISRSSAASIPGHRESYLVRSPKPCIGDGIRSAHHNAVEQFRPVLIAGISSISTGAGPCEDTHALTENCEIDRCTKGLRRFVLELALAGVK